MKSKINELEAEIRCLRTDLYMARKSILELLPEHVRNAVDGYFECKTREAVYAWESSVIDNLLAIAEHSFSAEVQAAGISGEVRAVCPVCGGGADSFYEGFGFAFPVGLTHHLSGTFNSRQCVPLAQIVGMCLEHVDMRNRPGAPDFDALNELKKSKPRRAKPSTGNR